MSSTDAAGSNQIVDGSVTEQKIRDGAIKASHLQAGAVGVAAIGAASIKNSYIDVNDGPMLSREFLYDFSVLGGAVSALTLTAVDGTALTIPDNAELHSASITVYTTATSGGSATIKLGFTGNDNAFMPVTAYNNGEFTTADTMTIVAAELPVKMSAAVSVLATVATAALTAGKFRLRIFYTQGA